jgi:hypothetical protein
LFPIVLALEIWGEYNLLLLSLPKFQYV